MCCPIGLDHPDDNDDDDDPSADLGGNSGGKILELLSMADEFVLFPKLESVGRLWVC